MKHNHRGDRVAIIVDGRVVKPRRWIPARGKAFGHRSGKKSKISLPKALPRLGLDLPKLNQSRSILKEISALISPPLGDALSHRLQTPLPIGDVLLNSRVLQAPLSGVTDLVFRRLVRRYAPDSMMYTEMVQARGLCHARQLPQIMEIDPNEQPVSIQLFDCRPDFMAEAAQMAVAEGAQTIDINMGCPVNKITKNGGGSSLLRDPDTAAAIVRTVVAAVSVPVTVKTRIGWSDTEINILEFAQRLQAAGAQMITVHARTRSQGYHGAANWDWIRRVKAALSIPVIANGDIVSVAAALQCLQETGADGVMCSRGTLGNPFLVGEIDHYFKTGQLKPETSLRDRLRCAQEHLQALFDYKGRHGLLQARKHMTWYATGFHGCHQLREQLCLIESVQEGCDLLELAIAKNCSSSVTKLDPPS